MHNRQLLLQNTGRPFARCQVCLVQHNTCRHGGGLCTSPKKKQNAAVGKKKFFSLAPRVFFFFPVPAAQLSLRGP